MDFCVDIYDMNFAIYMCSIVRFFFDFVENDIVYRLFLVLCLILQFLVFNSWTVYWIRILKDFSCGIQSILFTT